MNWSKNQDCSMVEHQAKDLEVLLQIPDQVQIFLLKFMIDNKIIATFRKVILIFRNV